MTIESVLYDTLKSLCANHVYPDTFPQTPVIPVVPAIRYTRVSGTVYIDLCGDGDEQTDDVRIQVDMVESSAGKRDALVVAVRAAMKSFDPPAVAQGPTQNSFDPETKQFIGSVDYIVYGSSN